MKRYTLYIIYTLLVLTASAAELEDTLQHHVSTEARAVERMYLFGIGTSNQLDTYLTPLEYSGIQGSFLTRINRQTRWADGHVHYQGTFLGAFSHTRDARKHGEEWGGHVGYTAGWHYVWEMPHRWTLKAGGLLGADAGFLYNMRNSNNPAQGRFRIDVIASLGAGYTWIIRQRKIRFNYQADIPLLGVMFSPQFGQSYYELSLGNRDHNVCCAWPGNGFNLRQTLLVEYPFRYFSLQAGYLWDVRQSHVNNIKMHDISHSFLIGFCKRFSVVKNH